MRRLWRARFASAACCCTSWLQDDSGCCSNSLTALALACKHAQTRCMNIGWRHCVCCEGMWGYRQPEKHQPDEMPGAALQLCAWVLKALGGSVDVCMPVTLSWLCLASGALQQHAVVDASRQSMKH